LHPCEHCGIDPSRIVTARGNVLTAVQYLRGGRGDRVIMPNYTYESGVLDALNWVLGVDDDGLFQRHLDSLALIREDILAELEQARDRSPKRERGAGG